MCPDRIDQADYKSHLDKRLSKHEHDLFSKWYKQVDSDGGGSSYYRLEIDLNAHKQLLADDLNKLARVLYAHFGEASTAGETTSDDCVSSLRLKYLKSVQQDELELISRCADPNMIIWVHLVVVPSTAGESTTATPTTSETARFNKARYALIFDLLKDKVLNHNYKQIRLSSSSAAAADDEAQKQHLVSVNEFLFNSIKLLVDAITLDLDKSAISILPLSNFTPLLPSFIHDSSQCIRNANNKFVDTRFSTQIVLLRT